ncbi:MAG: LapA family protein [Alphaproteobacteria bacterium]|nr:LapA family protein [Alphaproteobacteria bacterium]
MKFISRLFSWLISLTFLVVCVLFAVNNRQEITIDCWPFDYDIKTPLFVITLGGFLAGLVLGATLLWFTSLRTHWDKRKLSKQVDKLKTQLNEETKV